jgi:hypothetical protein
MIQLKLPNLFANIWGNKKNIYFCNAFRKTALSIETSFFGEMAEWSIAAVLKTVVPKGTGGSNPSLSA